MIRYLEDRSAVLPCLISALTTRNLLTKGCQGILAYKLDTKMKVQVVKDFLDKELPGLFSDKEIEFGIDVITVSRYNIGRLPKIKMESPLIFSVRV